MVDLKFFLFDSQRTIHEVTRSVTKRRRQAPRSGRKSAVSCDFVDRVFLVLTKESEADPLSKANPGLELANAFGVKLIASVRTRSQAQRILIVSIHVGSCR